MKADSIRNMGGNYRDRIVGWVVAPLVRAEEETFRGPVQLGGWMIVGWVGDVTYEISAVSPSFRKCWVRLPHDQ